MSDQRRGVVSLLPAELVFKNREAGPTLGLLRKAGIGDPLQIELFGGMAEKFDGLPKQQVGSVFLPAFRR